MIKESLIKKKKKNEIFTTNHDLLELSKSERQNVYLEKIMTYEVDISFDQSHRFNGKDDVLMKGISKYLHCLNFNKTVIKKSSLHNIFEDLNSIIFILDSVKLDNIVIKCGYIFNIIAKLLFMTRHNLLGALYQTIDKGKDEFIMNTDVNLRDLGVDSNKTPDFLVFNEDNIQLIDFAVISDVEKLEDQKGGIDLNKYSNEADEISRMYDLPVIRKTIYFETSTGATNTKIDDYKDEFISFCNDVGKYWKYNLIDDENVNELKSDIVNKMVSSTNESIKNYNEVNQQYVSSSLPEGFLEKYKKSKDKLLNKAILNLDESGKYRMIFSRRGVFLEKDDNGFMISEWIVIIRKDDYFNIHKNLFCYFKGKFSKYKPGINDIVVNTTIDEMNEFSYSNGSGFSINSADTSVNVKTNHMPAYTTSNFYDNEKISNMLIEDSIVDNKVDKDQVEEAVTLSKNKFVELHNLQKNRVKSPFIFNFPEVEKLITVENIKQHTIENIVVDIPQIGDRFIDDLLSKINNRKFSSGYKKIIPENLLDKSRDIESELNKILMRNCIDIKNRKKELKNLKESDLKVQELINSRKAVSNEIRKISEFVPTKIKCVKYSNYETQTLIRNSYNWDDDNTNRCYKDEQDNNPIDLLLDYLSEQHSSFLRKTPLKVDNSNDLDFFTKLNDSYVKEYENEYKDFRNMKIAYILDFISKLCYNLFYLSQTTNRGNEIMVENLGFSMCIHKNLFCYFKGKFSKYKPGINDIVVNTTIDEMNEFSYSNGSGFSINSADTSVNVKTNHMPAYTTSNFYDNGKLSDMLEEDSIVDNKVDKEQVEEAVTLSKNKFVELHNLQKNRVKSPFIFNFPEVEKLITVENIKKHTIENIVIDIPQIGDRFIDDLLSKINNRKFSSGYKKIIPENLLDKSRDIESELNKILMRNCIDIKNRKKELKNLKESDQKVLELINSRKAVSNEIRKISEFVPTKIKCVKYSNYETQTLIRNSYNWDDDSTNRCYKDEQDNNPIDLLLDYLSEQHSSFLRKTPLKVDNSNDLDFFTKLNDSYIKEYENEYKDFRNMKIAYILDFISKLCYNLFYLSQTTNRGNEIMVENLGFSNVLLMVRGGKKLFKKRRSREFRLIMPCSDKLANFINMNDKFSSFQYINGFMITPWQSLHENELHKGLSCYESCLNYYLISSNRLKKDYASNLKTTMFPIMLFLHGRRITEGTLHNLRYILVNSLATYSSIKQALPDLMFKSKDWIQFHLQKKLLGSYLNYFLENDIKNKKFDFSHIFCNGIVKSDYAFTLLCYSTYLMTKSPTDKTIDQVHNLEKMMKIHSKFEEDRINEDDFLNLEQYNYDSKYFSNKETLFNFSSNLSYESGFILANKLQSLGLVSNIHEHWSDSINKSLCNIVNESGLRYKSTHFFSKKSSFIFTQALLEKLPNNFISSLKDFTEEEVYDKLKKFDNFDVTYKDVYSNLLNNKVPVFHVLDKEQRGLGREIYVMDLDTKILQQPLEDFFKKICKHVPNELISVPSNKRLNLIHHDVFEGDKMRNSWTFASLDCSKWAPQCNINKYLYFISGMSHIFPAGFLNYFYKFFERYYQKRVFINKRVYKAFHNNEKNKSISHFFKYDEDVDAYSFKMPYSFVMGIFNYLSSLMHAAGVMLAQSKMNIYLNEENNYINYHINVHSDDSGGLISATNEDTLELAIKGYELIQRRLNHNLSKKKCNFSNNYFEILSILYVNNKLLPLVNKFITNIQYEPTDTGPCTDMISCVSKSISLMSYGCTFSESYISKIIMSNMICDFYKIDQRSDLPLQAFGQPTSNPLLDLMVGGDSDIVRLLYVEGMAKDTDIYNHLKLLMLNEFDSEVVSIPSYKYKPRLKLNKSLKDQIIELDEFLKPLLEILPEDILKLIPNIGKKHIMSKLIEIHSNYKNINFISSMLYENNSRKMSRSLNYKNKTCMKTIFGYYSPKDLQKKHDYWHDLLKNRALFKEEADSKIADKLFNEKLVLLSEFMNSHKKTINYFKFLNDKLNPNFTMKKTNITNKPVYFYYNPEFHGIVLNTSPSNSYLYNNYPKYNFFATSSKVSKKAFELIVKKLKSDNIDAFLSYSRKYEKFQNKTYYIYSQVKSDLRTVDKNIDYYNFLMQSSFYHYELSRLIPNVNKLFYDFKINSKNDDDIDNLSAYKTYLELKPELQGEVEINEDFEELQKNQNLWKVLSRVMMNLKALKANRRYDLNELNFWYSWKNLKRIGTGWVEI
uniref:RNA-directed RNA polymerase L n=3 Tax=Halophytophthora RNA virus 7 TaxID=2717549 RepID=A0A7D5G173_9VIRU|nr:RNA-dependent RNA polymerase [Halophytophthora RNA virus 7]